MAYFICEKQGRCCPHEFYDSIEQAITDSEDGVPCDHLIEVAPVQHGMWETIDASTWRWSHDGAKPVHRVKYRHNECGRVVQRKEPYCPTCGAKMDLEE